MYTNITQTSIKDLVIVPFYDLPFGSTFRYHRQWCVKIGYNFFVSENWGDMQLPIAPDKLTIVDIKELWGEDDY